MSRRSAVVGTLGAGLAACSRKPGPGAGAGAPDAPAYLAPPTLTGAERGSDGAVRITGRSQPRARVSLHAPEGDLISVKADDQGGWSLVMASPLSPRLYAFEAETHGRVIKGEGALAVMPAPSPPALVLRPGFPSVPAGPHDPARLQLVSVEMDGGGFAASGFAPPRTRVALSVDGAVLCIALSGADGRFGLIATDPQHAVKAGAHTVRVETPGGLVVERPVVVAAPILAENLFYLASPAPGGWAITWRLPGGGLQSSRVFENAVAGARA